MNFMQKKAKKLAFLLVFLKFNVMLFLFFQG